MTQNTKGPLSGILVIDLSRILAGPYCTLLMAEMGARVIKVEPPKGGDDARAYGPFVNGKSTYFASVNRGKESIALDLKADGDRKIFEKLLEKADVVVENFRPGTMEKLGYGWETLHAKYPQLIYASASGFGHTGPNSKDPAYDMVMQGQGGIMSITGNEGQPPSRVGMSIGDIGAGLYTAVAVNAAIVHRLKTGESTKVDIAMFDCQLALLENAIMRYTVEKEIPGPLGARHPTITPFEAFATSDGSMIIAAGNDSLFVKMCEALGRSDMATDPAYKSNALRQKSQKKLKDEIESVLKTNTTDHWIAVVSKGGVPCGPINNIAQAIEHPQVAARNMLVDVPDGSGGTLKLAGNPLKMSAFPDPTTRRPAPDLDSDRDTILSYLGG
ncbi:CoA transferase [Reyranella sp. MMS21-HV4-11]|jgi:CoA:oxalate CoA-transferase|uniref:CoA transferase n=1 Tax=Reyranella humidisoli TaxID=2849149 RepID=A0ABS6IQC2_9HYPH|nr:CaiB/BaiF CoA-transferase family protein [Reyranella sp. MMS21-HV4-11]MBU8876802.1 CoA transferase [Reyranella sp. MMS21-HV4-11]